MFKILYAANNSFDSKIRLWRFLQNVDKSKFSIKIAAYKKSSPAINIDWTLDALLDVFNPNKQMFDNDNLRVYYDQVKAYDPDLIISDLELFTSYIALQLNKKVWQVSPTLLPHALSYADKYNLGVRNSFRHFFKHRSHASNYMANILKESDKKYIYSHFMDTDYPPNIKDDFEWIRPYYLKGNDSKPCHHAFVAAAPSHDSKFYNFMNTYDDSVLFCNSTNEIYSNITIKSIEDEQEYICNLKNSDIFVNQGHISFMADAFYNKKFSLILADVKDLECASNSMMSESLSLSSTFTSRTSSISIKKINPVINNNVKFLHEKLNDLFY